MRDNRANLTSADCSHQCISEQDLKRSFVDKKEEDWRYDRSWRNTNVDGKMARSIQLQ